MNAIANFVFALSLMVLLSPIARAQDAPPAGRPVLRGSVSHSDTLAPVDPYLREGAVFDAGRLPKPKSGNVWYRIPGWSAGHWKTETSTCYYARDLRTGLADRQPTELVARAEEDVGFQSDRLGDIWEYQHGSYIQRVDAGDHLVVQMVHLQEPLSVSEDKVVLRFQSINVSVDQFTRRIMATKQVESIQTYTPYGVDTLRCVSSIKAFDSNGKPNWLQRNVSYKRRTASYKPWNSYKGRDLRKLFRDYLVAQGLEHLVPEHIEQAYGPRELRARQGRLVLIPR
ncbi:MAG TPA: hypothetical protein V6D08_02195 [Candidatus Obscuribacterales bacterium]